MRVARPRIQSGLRGDRRTRQGVTPLTGHDVGTSLRPRSGDRRHAASLPPRSGERPETGAPPLRRAQPRAIAALEVRPPDAWQRTVRCECWKRSESSPRAPCAWPSCWTCVPRQWWNAADWASSRRCTLSLPASLSSEGAESRVSVACVPVWRQRRPSSPVGRFPRTNTNREHLFIAGSQFRSHASRIPRRSGVTSWQHRPHRRSPLLILSLRQSYLHQNPFHLIEAPVHFRWPEP